MEKRRTDWEFKAVKLHQCFQRFEVDSTPLKELADFARGKGLPVFIHLYAGRDARAFLGLAAAHPETIFIVAHLLGLEVFVRAGAARMPNLFSISPSRT